MIRRLLGYLPLAGLTNGPVLESTAGGRLAERMSPIEALCHNRTIMRLRRFAKLRVNRAAVASLSLPRLFHGGRIDDPKRLPRYRFIYLLGLAGIWVPIVVYLKVAPVRYTSQLALILPGTGVSTSVNLSEIGQATTSANSPYSSPSLSPTVLYKNILESDGMIERAARSMSFKIAEFGKPMVKLVDMTSLIHIDISGKSPEQAHDKAEAVLAALRTELDNLREDEIRHRESSAAETVNAYQENVNSVRAKISALQLQSGLNSTEQYGGIVSATETLQIRVAEANAILNEKEGAVRSLSEMLRISPEMAAATLKAHADPELASISAAAAKSAADLAELEKLFGPRHPKFLDAQSRAHGAHLRLLARGAVVTGLSTDAFRNQIDMFPTGERVALLSRLVTLVAERDGLAAQLKIQTGELEKNRTRVHDLVEIASKLDTLNRDYKVADAVFASALARINTSKTDLFASYPLIQVAEPATMPLSPSSPNGLIAGGAGVAASLFLAIGLALAWLRRPIIDLVLAKRGEFDEGQ